MTDPSTTAVSPPRFTLGEGQAAFDAACDRARDESWANRLFDRDTTLWSDDPDVQAAIADRLGWLDAPEHFTDRIAGLEGFGDGIVAAGFATAIVAGMGGSSLAPDVLHRTFGSQDGYLALRILDSTDPAYVSATIDDLDPLTTLTIIASKSGTTTEPNAFLADAWTRAEAAMDARKHHHSYDNGGATIVAITDPGKSVEALAHHDDFREVFLNPPDIGGRYSALTYVGLVPASLIGLDLDALLASATTMLGACRQPDPTANPGVSLGLAIGTLAAAGRDKLTFLVDDEIESLGGWLEQLIAESTGKHGVGIVPVDLEPLGEAASYGPDRVFVRIALTDGTAGAPDGPGHGPRRGRPPGHPDHRQRPDRPRRRVRPLGGRDGHRRGGPRHRPVRPAQRRGGQGADPDRAGTPRGGPRRRTPDPAPLAIGDGTGRRGRRPSRRTSPAGATTPISASRRSSPHPPTPMPRSPGSGRCCGTGPGGPRPPATARASCTRPGSCTRAARPAAGSSSSTSDHAADRPIPGWPYTFGQLIDGQAAGDLAAIEAHGLPILRVHLGSDIAAGLAALERALAAALDTTAATPVTEA